jgi:hypothetical protein
VLYALFTCPKGDHTSSRLYCESCDVLPIVFHFLYQYIADSSVSDDAGENYACNTLAFKMTRFLCVPRIGVDKGLHFGRESTMTVAETFGAVGPYGGGG